MFRIGGSAGEGITSGLTPRVGFSDGTTLERLTKAAGPVDKKQGLNDFLVNFGLDLVSRPPSGSIFSTAAEAAKAPYAQFSQTRAADANLRRQLAIEAEKMDIGHEQDIDIEEIKNDPARTATGLKIKELQGIFPDKGPEYERRLKDILAGTSTEKDISKIAAALITSGQVSPEDAAEQALTIWYQFK